MDWDGATLESWQRPSWSRMNTTVGLLTDWLDWRRAKDVTNTNGSWQ